MCVSMLNLAYGRLSISRFSIYSYKYNARTEEFLTRVNSNESVLGRESAYLLSINYMVRILFKVNLEAKMHFVFDDK